MNHCIICGRRVDTGLFHYGAHSVKHYQHEPALDQVLKLAGQSFRSRRHRAQRAAQEQQECFL